MKKAKRALRQFRHALSAWRDGDVIQEEVKKRGKEPVPMVTTGPKVMKSKGVESADGERSEGAG